MVQSSAPGLGGSRAIQRKKPSKTRTRVTPVRTNASAGPAPSLASRGLRGSLGASLAVLEGLQSRRGGRRSLQRLLSDE
jgi:hypothetical protein